MELHVGEQRFYARGDAVEPPSVSALDADTCQAMMIWGTGLGPVQPTL